MKNLFLIVSLLFSLAGHAGDWKLNDQHTQIQFQVDYMGVMEVTGLFTQVRGKLQYDQQSHQAQNVLVQIATRSIQTHNNKRDNHLRRADFFSVAAFPWIEFTIDQVDLSPGTRTVRGQLSMRGVTKEIPLQLTVQGLRQDPWDETKSSLFFRVQGTIKRSDFGLTWNKTIEQGGLLVGEDVRFSADVEANPSDQKLAFSRFYLPNGTTRSKLVEASQLPPEAQPILPEGEVKPPIETAAKDATNPGSVVIGFVIFLIIVALCLWLKINLQKFLQVNLGWKYLKAELTSDLVLLLFTLGAFAMTAPLMGYGS